MLKRRDILASIEERVESLLKEKIEAIGYELYDVEYSKEGKNYFLRIFIDKPEGIDLNDCEKVNNEIDEILDEADYIKEQYFLEVSSPGLERKFKSDKEFEIFKNKRISIKLKTPLEGETERIFKGEILDWSDTEGLTFFRFDDGQELHIPKSNIQSAKLYVD